MRDVATLAGTSVATVSRVLNNTGYVAAETRVRVQQATETLNYQPNLRAKGLRRGVSHTIGVLIPNLLNAYYTALADSISLRLTENGYQLLLSSSRDDPAIEWETLRTLIGHDVDGLIWVPTDASPKLLDYLHTQMTPVISVVRRVNEDAVDTVVFEDFLGSQTAAQHLIQLGHQRIGFICGDIQHSSNHERWQGYLAALQTATIPVESALVKLGTARDTWGSLATNELLQLSPPPTALYVASNAIMSGVMKTLHQHRVDIPGQLSLICFDDLEWFSYASPPISAIATSHERVADTAVDLLLRRIAEPYDPDHQPILIQVGFELVVRSSTIPLR